MRPRLVLLVTLAMAASACTSQVQESGPQAGGAAPTASSPASVAVLLEPADFAAAVAEPARFLVNVHVPDEGAIRGTDAAIPYDRIAELTAELPPEVNTPLAVYCKSGRMSAVASAALLAMGYTDVVELRGGMDAWSADGRDLLPPGG